MSENKKLSVDELCSELEKGTGMKVHSIVDLNDEELVVTFETNTLPGTAFKINKKTGDSKYFVPDPDDETFWEAARKRSKTFK